MNLCICESGAVENLVCVISSIESQNHNQSIFIEFRVLRVLLNSQIKHGTYPFISLCYEEGDSSPKELARYDL
jgi:hypothetical protein